MSMGCEIEWHCFRPCGSKGIIVAPAGATRITRDETLVGHEMVPGPEAGLRPVAALKEAHSSRWVDRSIWPPGPSVMPGTDWSRCRVRPTGEKEWKQDDDKENGSKGMVEFQMCNMRDLALHIGCSRNWKMVVLEMS